MVNGSDGPALICQAVIVEVAKLELAPGETLLVKMRGKFTSEIMDRIGSYVRGAVPEGCKVMVVDDTIEFSKLAVAS